MKLNSRNRLPIVLMLASVGFSLPCFAQTHQGFYGKPARLRNLSDLRLIEGTDLTHVQKMEVLLSWLVSERNNPSAPSIGLGGGVIDSNYTQAQIVKALAAWGDPTEIGWVTSSTSLNEESLRDCMILAIGGKGDKAQIKALERILLDNPNPYLRAIAADDLGSLVSVSSASVLEIASKDAYSQTFASEANAGKVTTYYPVRQAAGQALKIFNNADLLAKKRKFAEADANRLTEAKKHPPIAPFTAEHFVAIANGD